MKRVVKEVGEGVPHVPAEVVGELVVGEAPVRLDPGAKAVEPLEARALPTPEEAGVVAGAVVDARRLVDVRVPDDTREPAARRERDRREGSHREPTEVDLRLPEGVEEVLEVVGEGLDHVGARVRHATRAAEPAEIGQHEAPLGGEGEHAREPHRPVHREAVHEHDRGPPAYRVHVHGSAVAERNRRHLLTIARVSGRAARRTKSTRGSKVEYHRPTGPSGSPCQRPRRNRETRLRPRSCTAEATSLPRSASGARAC